MHWPTTFRRSFAACLIVLMAISPASAGSLTDDAVAFVKLGYGDRFKADFRSLDFLTDELDTPAAQAVVAVVDHYNAYDGARVAAALARFDGRISHYRFGRDQSPVLFIALPHWTGQRERMPAGERGERIDGPAHAKLVAELREVFVDQLQADEFDADPVFHAADLVGLSADARRRPRRPQFSKPWRNTMSPPTTKSQMPRP